MEPHTHLADQVLFVAIQGQLLCFCTLVRLDCHGILVRPTLGVLEIYVYATWGAGNEAED